MKFSFKRSKFTPHSSRIASLRAGKIYPILVREMYPGDTITIWHQALLRTAPMLFPLYSPMKLTFDYFYSPNRIVWKGDETKDWSAFITGSINGKKIEDPDKLPKLPYITVPEGGFGKSSLADYLGFDPSDRLEGAKLSALRFRHYQKIISDYYADENLSTMPEIAYTEGEDTTTSLDLFTRCWNKDRFTTASLDPSSGESVMIPIGNSAPVVGNGNSLGLTNGVSDFGLVSGQLYINTDREGVLNTSQSTYALPASGLTERAADINNSTTALGVSKDSSKSGLVADLEAATGIGVDELHFLVQLQRLNQQDAFWGTRDFECIYTHFGVVIPDTRLQRATFLGRSCVDVNFSEVLQTSQSTDSSPQGNITGHALAVDQNNPIHFNCSEHGYIFVLVNIQPIAQYCQGIPRDAMYRDRYSYMWPEFSETGQQEIYSAELYATRQNIDERKIFGYEPRFNHLRFGDKTVHGDFRDNLSGYHTARIFSEEPELNENFIRADVTQRMFAVNTQDIDQYWLRVEFDINHVRRLPKWPTPSAIGKLF
ncbi:major capsid protein [Capybara microvirus Cap1_SP_259]|nr:major capsid protein [Capybara microvirus Cap1_SP_259]